MKLEFAQRTTQLLRESAVRTSHPDKRWARTRRMFIQCTKSARYLLGFIPLKSFEMRLRYRSLQTARTPQRTHSVPHPRTEPLQQQLPPVLIKPIQIGCGIAEFRQRCQLSQHISTHIITFTSKTCVNESNHILSRACTQGIRNIFYILCNSYTFK
ncbi:hypothetical protein BDU57DRAFT_350011 [Ampelomyces quisqualis]|uniref:Uncharacterized protein n=1 Tax=Ampelomyces quisqualis TaxID=50730 RepID=A0A6A5QD09_AMPQU|nr:hypothetical protein BDU57DRAFT_350011 [Ampelomyces quisqualis]